MVSATTVAAQMVGQSGMAGTLVSYAAIEGGAFSDSGLVGRVPVGVQVVSSRYREDLCLAAGEAIEAGGTPSAAIDPAG